jgi:DNA-binding NarL/FixJ family response regulator
MPVVAAQGLRMTRVLLVDDHPMVRAGCQRLLELEGDIRVVAQATSVDEACALHARHAPDITITDLSLPGSGGLELIRRLRMRDEGVRVMVFSMLDSESLVRRAFELGARGYVPKSAAPEALVQVLREVMQGRRALAPGLPARLLEPGTAHDPFGPLTPREFEVFRLLARGLPSGDCARALHLSPKTVANLQSQVKDKLGTATTAAMAHLALRHGLIALDEG